MVRGIHQYPPMERVIYGIPLQEALEAEIKRLDSQAVYVMASGTLARQTDAIDQVRSVLGNRLAGVCAKIGAHTPRIDVVAAANEARAMNQKTFPQGSTSPFPQAIWTGTLVPNSSAVWIVNFYDGSETTVDGASKGVFVRLVRSP